MEPRPRQAFASARRASIEALLVALAIALVFPAFAPLAERDAGRDARFARDAVLVDGLPAATIPADARASQAGNAKDAAMRRLLRDAGLQWAAWAVIGLVLLHLARAGVPPLAGTALALAAWATAAWLGGVPAPFAADRGFVPGHAGGTPWSAPAGYVVALLATSGALLAIAPWLDARPRPRQRMGSTFAYPGLVLATGIGWVVLLDLSANAHFANRYLALYHHGHLWLGMLAFGVAAFVRQPLGQGLAWTLSVVDAAGGRLVHRLGFPLAAVLLVGVGLVAAATLATVLANMRQFTSELGRLWLVVGAAWFFFLRGTPLARRVAGSASTPASLVRYVAPLAFVSLVLAGAMFATRDMGPLLIAGYGAGAFVAASVAMWWHERTGAAAAPSALAALVFLAWIGATTTALFRFGEIEPVTAGRIENAAAPLASANDQLALAAWFRRATPDSGFGPGAVPWCGYGPPGGCAGVPAQIQSDYTFTALVGVFGAPAAWAMTIGGVAWLWATVHAHAAATSGEPRLRVRGGRTALDAQAFVSWLCVAWVVLATCQLAVTVAGNLAVIPLTGVTFPFVSFGMTSLVVNMALLGLAANLDAEDAGA